MMSTEATRAEPVRRNGRARARLLEAAARLFYADGIAATGIDSITAEAGVAKMSLYNNFTSKADLVAAYLDARHEEWLQLYTRRAASASTPAEAIDAVFDAYIDHASLAYLHGFRGCGLLNAAAELPASDPGRAVVRRHKEDVEEILRTQLRLLVPEARAEATAQHLSFLLEGSMARAGLDGDQRKLLAAQGIARALVAAL